MWVGFIERKFKILILKQSGILSLSTRIQTKKCIMAQTKTQSNFWKLAETKIRGIEPILIFHEFISC